MRYEKNESSFEEKSSNYLDAVIKAKMEQAEMKLKFSRYWMLRNKPDD